MNVDCYDPSASNTQVFLYNTLYGKYAFVGPKNLGLHYSITPVNNVPGLEHVQRVILPDHFSNKCIRESEVYFLDQTISWVTDIRNGIDLHVENIYKIADRLGWQPRGKGLACIIEFKDWLLNDYQTDHASLNLSGLGITLVPPHLGLFSELQRLDLSNNNIRVLPVELQSLKKIQSINLRNNPIVELPPWLKEMAHVDVKTDIIEEDQEYFGLHISTESSV